MRRHARSLRRAACLAALLGTTAVAVGLPADATPAVDPCASASCATLEISATGDGSGRVTSDSGGIDCVLAGTTRTGKCSATFVLPSFQRSITVALVLQADPGSKIAIYRGGSAPPSSVTVTWVMAGGHDSFTGDWFRFLLNSYRVGLTASGGGKIQIKQPLGVPGCGTSCAFTVKHGTALSIEAAPDTGAAFRGWTGACNGQDATCKLTVKGPIDTNAVFGLATSPPPPPAPAPPPPSPPPPPVPADRTVEAAIGAAKAMRTPLGARVVRIELDNDEPLVGTLTLRRNGKSLATRKLTVTRPGARLLNLLVPKGVLPGGATLKLELADAAGNRIGARRQVRIGEA